MKGGQGRTHKGVRGGRRGGKREWGKPANPGPGRVVKEI